jgi:hypothetical protein
MCEVAFHCERADFLRITLLSRSHRGLTDYWAGNWIRVEVEVKAGGFRGSVRGDIHADELARFYDSFVPLQRRLKGTACFETIEHWLSITITPDRHGHMEVRSNIRDEPSFGNTLDCTLATDQTFTRRTLSQLGEAVRAFPVIGKP